MKTKRIQTGVRIAQGLKRKVGKDRLNYSTTADIVFEVALENFFSAFTPEQRANFYAAHSRKPFQTA